MRLASGAQVSVSGEARLRAALTLLRHGKADAAHAALRTLAEELSAWDEPRLQLALSLRRAGASQAAEREYAAVVELNPTRTEALLGLAALLMLRGEALGARSLLRRCCGLAPGLAEAWDALGVSLMMTEDAGAAESAFAEAQRLAPAMIDYALHRAEAAVESGSGPGELARLERATEQNPFDIASLCARGLLLDKFGRGGEAADLLEAASTLAPDRLEPALLLWRVLAALNRPGEAEQALQRVIALEPDKPQHRHHRAALLIRLQRHPEARALLEGVLDEHGREPNALANLACSVVTLGEQNHAARLAEEAIALAPDAVLPRRTLCNVLPYHQDATGRALLAAARACADRLPRVTAPRWQVTPDPDRRLRVGLLSGSLKTHPVGWLTAAGLEALDPAGFEIVCLSQTSFDDPFARRFRSLASAWHMVNGLDDAAVAALARAQSIDVLLDLGGYGEGGRMTVCAYRAAPVQVKWVGMQNHSSGLPEMDWMLTDRWETPPGFDELYSERLLRLPDGYVCYSPPPHAPDVVTLPALANGFVTFGCFNNLAKITPRVIARWGEILRALPTSRLLLKTHQFADPATRARVHAAFAEHDIAPSRVELQRAAPHRQFLAEYNNVDLVLDPFPYSGGLTTCEALWMGVPTVTMPGETFASRHSTSHMCNVGLDDWVATDLDHYIALALSKATALPALAALRAGLRQRTKLSPLCDAPRFGRGLAAALRHAWREWCLPGVRHMSATPQSGGLR